MAGYVEINLLDTLKFVPNFDSFINNDEDQFRPYYNKMLMF